MVKIDFVNAQEPAINDTNLNQMQLNIENAINAQVSGDTLPVGCIVPFTSDTVPENWLLCDGSAISRTEYDLLFSIIGTSYGVGDGSTTFNLPNLKGRVAVGKDTTQTEFDTLGETGGEKTHTLTIDEIPSHNHSINGTAYALSGIGSQEFGPGGANSLDVKTTLSIGNTGGSQPHNILQPYQVINYIIKARQSSGLVATVIDGLNSTSTTDALSANQGRILNEKFTRKIATRTLSNQIYSTGEQRISFDQINTTTNKLMADNGAIRIGAGVSKVLVSANVFAVPDSDYLQAYTWTYIRQNGGVVSIAIAPNVVHFTSTVHSPILVNVQEGDLIDLYKNDDAHSTIRAGSNTYLTVEIVE